MSAIEVAALLGNSKFTVYRMVRGNQIPHMMIAGSLRFDPSALELWLIREAAGPRRRGSEAQARSLKRGLVQSSPTPLPTGHAESTARSRFALPQDYFSFRTMTRLSVLADFRQMMAFHCSKSVRALELTTGRCLIPSIIMHAPFALKLA